MASRGIVPLTALGMAGLATGPRPAQSRLPSPPRMIGGRRRHDVQEPHGHRSDR